MRAVLIPIVLLMTILLGQTQPPARSAPPDVGPGRVGWFDLTSSDVPRSRAFYGQLFGGTFGAVQGSDQAFNILARGEAIGTLRAAEGTVSAFNGVVYVQVADLKASCDRAAALGGTLAPGFPFNLPDGAGAVALALDPAGHPIGMYSKTPLSAVRAVHR